MSSEGRWGSQFVLGGIPPTIEDEIKSDWFHHLYVLKKISPFTEHVPALDFTKAMYGNHTLFKSDNQFIVLNTNEMSTLLRVGSGAKSVYNELKQYVQQEVPTMECSTQDGVEACRSTDRCRNVIPLL